jgi:hypothetical protein
MFTEIYGKLFETGKVLSDNNYTDAEQTKLSGIETGAQVNAANTVIDASYVHTDNNYSTAEKNKVTAVTPPAVGTLTTGSNAINLTNIAGQEYNVYDMASGALTLTIAASPVRGASAYGIIIADGATVPTVSAFTVFSGEYTNTNDVQNHFFIAYRLNASGVLTGYLTWQQPI